MAGSVNRVTLLGNVGRDPEVRTTQSGMKIVSLAIATSDVWNDKASGERQERTEWHRVVIMNDRLADVAEKFVRKGSKVYIEGKLQTRKWTDQSSGQDRYTTEIVLGRIGSELVLLDRPNAGSGGEAGRVAQPGRGHDNHSAPRAASASDATRAATDLDDEIPF